jgi:hypothetical protein
VRPGRPIAILVAIAALLLPGVAEAATFTPAPGSPYATPGAASLATADFTGDGVLDLAATGTSTNFVYSFLGDGAAGFSPASARRSRSSGSSPRASRRAGSTPTATST